MRDRVWFSLYKRLDEFMPDWSLSLHIVCHNGLELRIYDSPADMPIWKDRAQHGAAPAPAAASSSKADAVQEKCAAALHLPGQTLGDPSSKPRANMMLELVRPIWTAQSRETEKNRGEAVCF